MLRNLIVLPDGTEVFSGRGTVNAIKSVKITQAVNDQTELSLGSACSSMLEATIITPYGGLNIAAGSEITAYKVDDSGTRHLVGLYTLEKPTRPTANTYRITAYDRVSWLDKDLSEWLANLTVWPVELLTFAQMVCSECGLTLINETIPNGDYLIPQFSGSGITGRKLMQWVGEVCARFLRATPDGNVEFTKYTVNSVYTIGATRRATMALSDMVEITDDGNGNVSITSDYMTVEDDGDGNVTVTSDYLNVIDDGNGNITISAAGDSEVIPFYGGTLSYEDYQTAPIEKVQVRMTTDDVGVVYPEIEGNTYVIQGNYLMATSTTENILPVVQTIFGEISGIRYTPCRVSIPVSLGIRAGDIINITDKNGVTITAYVMTKTTSGQRDTLECTGSPRRDSSSVVNNEEFRDWNGKILELRKEVEGLYVANQDTEGRLAELSLSVDGLSTQVSQQNQEIEGVKTDLTAIRQESTQVSIQVQNIIENGVDKVITANNYSFTSDGMHIEREGEEISSRIDHTGLYVNQSEDPRLVANADGVRARDLMAENYLIIAHTRFEKYQDKYTACFYV